MARPIRCSYFVAFGVATEWNEPLVSAVLVEGLRERIGVETHAIFVCSTSVGVLAIDSYPKTSIRLYLDAYLVFYPESVTVVMKD